MKHKDMTRKQKDRANSLAREKRARLRKEREFNKALESFAFGRIT